MKIFNWIARKFKDWTKKKEPEAKKKGCITCQYDSTGSENCITCGTGTYTNWKESDRSTLYAEIKEAIKEAKLSFKADMILRTEMARYFNEQAIKKNSVAIGERLLEDSIFPSMSLHNPWPMTKPQKARKRKTRKKTRQK